MPFLPTAHSFPVLAGALLAIGAGIGTLDAVMNMQAVIVEKASGRPMMSGFHGLFSVGSIAGAGGMTGMVALGVSPLTAVLLVVSAVVLLLATFRNGLLSYGSEETSPPFALPRGEVLFLGALSFVLFLSEGSVLDWSGVYLTSVRGVDPSRSGLAYVAFATMMTIGRLSGDAIVRALGPRKIVTVGALCAATGFLLVVLVPSWLASVAGFGLVGAGASNVVPVLFSAAGRQTAMPSNLAIAAVTTMGYAGILSGPAIIGFVAHVWSLPLSLAVVASLLVAVAFNARVVSNSGR
jgi:fucose permease